MSQQAVRFIIHTLLTDRQFRDRFAESPMEVLAACHLSGDIDLTADEVDALVLASPDVWRSNEGLTPGRVH
jgi:hypothetical protein